jgi:hypothetical protein
MEVEMSNLFRSSPMFDSIEVIRETDWQREECLEDEAWAAAELCAHGISKDETCIDCREDAADDPDYNNDYGFGR